MRVYNGKATLSKKLMELLDNEEMVLVDAPKCRVQVIGPIVDRMSCQEQLLMKVAAVIGDTFDVQTLVRIQPFKNAIDNEKLIKIL